MTSAYSATGRICSMRRAKNASAIAAQVSEYAVSFGRS